MTIGVIFEKLIETLICLLTAFLLLLIVMFTTSDRMYTNAFVTGFKMKFDIKFTYALFGWLLIHKNITNEIFL